MTRWNDLAIWRATDQHGGRMTQHRGLVLHIAEGYYEGTIAWQRGNNGVSSHFVVGRETGECAQLVDTDVTAWTQRAGNGEWLSAEFAGFTRGHRLHRPGWHELSAWQQQIAAKLLVRGHLQYGYPLQLAAGAGGRGLGHHSMGGAGWGHQSCPGAPIIAQKDEILAAARKLAGVKPAPKPRRTLNRGDQGDDVRDLQIRANKVPSTGADVATDRVFGPSTEAKVRRVQRHYGLAVDGVVGPKTWAKLGVTW